MGLLILGYCKVFSHFFPASGAQTYFLKNRPLFSHFHTFALLLLLLNFLVDVNITSLLKILHTRTCERSSICAYATTTNLHLDIRCKRTTTMLDFTTLMISKKTRSRKKKNNNKKCQHFICTRSQCARCIYLQK